MKYKIILIFLSLILITGCGKKETLSCKLSDNSSNNYVTIINAEINNKNIVTSATATMTYDNADDAKTMCDILKIADDAKGNLNCQDKEIIMKNYHKSISGDNKLTKEKFLDYMNKNNYVCSN